MKERPPQPKNPLNGMAEELYIPHGADKAAKYSALLPQLQALIAGESDLVANLSNISAALFQSFGHLWIGFYLVKGEELVLGPFQGPIACTRIGFGKGVCGACWSKAETLIVPDVEQFPGHIACSSLSRSEIVVPGFKGGQVALVLDLDSTELEAFDEIDAQELGKVMRLIEPLL